MNVILLTRRRQSPIRLVQFKFITLFVLGLSLLVASAGYVGYRAGVAGWQTRAEAQREVLSRITVSTAQGLDALTSRIGELQSHMIRLDALGQRLTEVANLDKGEFDFQDPPAEGGPDVPLATQTMDIPALLRNIGDLGRRVDDRSQQLGVLESLLMNRKLQKEVHPSGRPIKAGWISSGFGPRVDPFTGHMAFHEGMDFAGKRGSPVLAVASGVVIYAGKRYGYGNLVALKHGNGYVTRYGHCMKILVRVGQKVKKGEEVALLGSTGRSTGPHVHLEVLHNGVKVNPAKYIQASR